MEGRREGDKEMKAGGDGRRKSKDVSNGEEWGKAKKES